jgi:hypothetical protein
MQLIAQVRKAATSVPLTSPIGPPDQARLRSIRQFFACRSLQKTVICANDAAHSRAVSVLIEERNRVSRGSTCAKPVD